MTLGTLDIAPAAHDTLNRPMVDQSPIAVSGVPVKQLLRWQDDGGAPLDAG